MRQIWYVCPVTKQYSELDTGFVDADFDEYVATWELRVVRVDETAAIVTDVCGAEYVVLFKVGIFAQEG